MNKIHSQMHKVTIDFKIKKREKRKRSLSQNWQTF